MAEYIESICRSCFHSYVCEQFNAHRNSYNEKCHYFNDHFVPAADVVEAVRCGECEYFAETVSKDSGKPYGYGQCKHPLGILGVVWADCFCSYGERKDGE